MQNKVPTIDDVSLAAERINGFAVRTPLLHSDQLDEIADARVFVKPECLQRTGSFKFRGAYNTIAAMDAELRGKGVVACSSGNHAQGVAEAARLFGIGATIVMPADAPSIKMERTRRSGANIVTYDRVGEDRDAIARKISEETGATLIHPFDNPFVIAGQGTCGLEIAQQLKQLDMAPDRVIVCTGGGGLTAGISLAVHDSFTDCRIHSAEPAGFDDHARSLLAGERQRNASLTGSICDALLSPMPGELTFSVNREHLESGLVVNDNDVRTAMRLAFNELKLVVEPGGAAALAALLQSPARWKNETIVVVISGGNVDPALFAKVISD